jgi:hypothetical protein
MSMNRQYALNVRSDLYEYRTEVRRERKKRDNPSPANCKCALKKKPVYQKSAQNGVFLEEI